MLRLRPERQPAGAAPQGSVPPPDHPLQARFVRLTRQEEHGLLTDPATIGTRLGWQARLRAAGWALRGHRLVRSPSA
jgi:hypothetical protein